DSRKLPKIRSSSRVPRRQRQRSLPSMLLICSEAPFNQQFLDLSDSLGRVQPLGACFGAVHDRVAAVQLERVFQLVQAGTGILVTRVHDPAIGLQQDGRTEITVAVPPIAGAGGGAA